MMSEKHSQIWGCLSGWARRVNFGPPGVESRPATYCTPRAAVDQQRDDVLGMHTLKGVAKQR